MYAYRVNPTLLETRNIRIVIYPNDHAPPHVHAIVPGKEAKFRLDTLECFYCKGFSRKQIKEIREFIEPRRKKLIESWETYHE